MRTRRFRIAALVAATVGAGLLVAPGAISAPTEAAAGTIISMAGSDTGGQNGFEGDGGPATAAKLYNPRAVAFDADGNAYIADTLNQRIRKITKSPDGAGVINTIAGSGATGFAGDGGPALEASFDQPHGVAVDADGNVYVADSANHRIRRITPDGKIATYAGAGTPTATGDGGPAAEAGLKDPKTLATDAAGAVLYIADTGNNRIRKIDLETGIINSVAGVTKAGNTGDGGPADKAQLNSPRGVAVSPDGVVYIADSDNHKIRKVATDGMISTVAGSGTPGFTGDGGPAAEAQLNDPRGVAVDSAGNVFIGEELGQRVRQVDATGVISTLAGNGTAGFAGDDGPATAAQFDHIRSVTLDGDGNLWIADTFNNRVRMIAGVAEAGTQTPPTTTPTTTTPPTGPGGGTTTTTTPPRSPSAPAKAGYWMLGQDGKIYPFADAKSLGDANAQLSGEAKAVHIEPTPTAAGYWVIDNLGNVFAFGDAAKLGGAPAGVLRPNEKVSSLSSTPSGKGYWLFTNKGRAIPLGDATHLGDLTDRDLNGPVLGSVATPTGKGYYMVASDGGVFAFGDAKFYGSMGDTKLNEPVESLVPSSDNKGYWLVAGDGGIFAFGTAPFRGSMGATPLNKPVVGMVRYGIGYLMVAADGGIFNFADRPFSGSLGDNPPPKPVVSVATMNAP